MTADSGPIGGGERPRRTWGRADVAALAAWTVALATFFRDVVGLRRALFYFDVTEINFPYRAFLARELRAGRFSRWCPDLYCGLPLYSESQAGYLHPWKYLLYPWMPTWQAFNLDTVLSVWLAGFGAYGWLRRHSGAPGALTGAVVFGLSGFTWAHLVHTSWINALAGLPLVFWALEWAWERDPGRGIVLGGLALAVQIFAGQAQAAIMTGLATLLYGLFRAATEHRGRPFAIALGVVALGGALAAVQWVPSKELIDRSPRAGGLSWADQTYGSWHPELLPTLTVREAYGTRARDTDWMDHFYPYHEMDVFLGVVALSLALVGASAYRDRRVGFCLVLAGLGAVLMLGRFTFVFDRMGRVPVVGSTRIPVRYHLWVALGVAGLAAAGVDRLARPGAIRLRAAGSALAVLTLAQLLVALFAYAPAWDGSGRRPSSVGRERDLWLAGEVAWAVARMAVLALVGGTAIVLAARRDRPAFRRRIAWAFPALALAELLGAHRHDVPTVDPSYWTAPPESVRALKADRPLDRILGIAGPMANAPGYASAPIDFFPARDTLSWSLATVWGLRSASGLTPIYPRRLLEFDDHATPDGGRFDIEGVTHLVTRRRTLPGFGEGIAAGSAFLHRNPGAFPRVRLVGRPLYVETERAAVEALDQLGPGLRDRLVVEDPDRPLAEDAEASGTAAIAREMPERVEVATDSLTASYLVLADTFDPGWSAELDGHPVPIRPAYVAFRAVFLPGGRHTVVFRYRPAGFAIGLAVTSIGLAVSVGLFVFPRRARPAGPPDDGPPLPRPWPWWALAAVAVVLVGSVVGVGPGGRLHLQGRWAGSFHRFTWGPVRP